MHAELADFMLDLVQNSIEAEAENISVVFGESMENIYFSAADDGRGMDKDLMEKALSPFFSDGTKHPGRKAGLGLPFLSQMSEQCGGTFYIDSTPGSGTVVKVSVPALSVDVPPAGNLPFLWLQCLGFDGDYQLKIKREKYNQYYTVNRKEIFDALGSLEDSGAKKLLLDYLVSLEESINPKE